MYLLLVLVIAALYLTKNLDNTLYKFGNRILKRGKDYFPKYPSKACELLNIPPPIKNQETKIWPFQSSDEDVDMDCPKFYKLTHDAKYTQVVQLLHMSCEIYDLMNELSIKYPLSFFEDGIRTIDRIKKKLYSHFRLCNINNLNSIDPEYINTLKDSFAEMKYILKHTSPYQINRDPEQYRSILDIIDEATDDYNSEQILSTSY